MRPTLPISRRRFHRRLLGGLGLPLAAPALTQAATAAPAPAPAAPPRHTPGSVVTLLTALEPPTLVGLVNSAAGTFLVSPKAVEGLLSYDFDLRPRAQLAVAWEVQPDGLQYTFRLRRGVKWHDGQDFTSADVAFSILALKASHPRGRATFASVAEVRTPDAHTAVLVLTKPAPFLLTALAAAESPIVAKHLYEGKDLASHPANNAPIGTGPFVFKEWVRGSHVLYERNPNYWDTGKPYIDRLVVRFIPDPAAAAAALESATVDLAGATPVPIPDLDRLKDVPHLSLDTRGNEYFNNSTTRIEFNLDNRYFKHAKVRQAVAHAIDRDVILKTVWYGYGVGAPGPISPVLKGFYDPNVAVPRFDRKRAEALLDEAGFPRGADGVRFRVSHDVFDGGGNRVGQYIRQALARVGIDVSVRTQEFGSYIKRVYTERDFDFNNQGMSQMFDPTVGIQRFYWSKNFRPGVPFSNGAHYDNPEVDRLLEAAAVENDAAKRRALFSEFQRVIATELPTIGLVAVAQVTVANRRIGGHTVGAEGLSGNFADIHIKTRA
jgi:peptide/nickel transport system substrate-binding protein